MFNMSVGIAVSMAAVLSLSAGFPVSTLESCVCVSGSFLRALIDSVFIEMGLPLCYVPPPAVLLLRVLRMDFILAVFGSPTGIFPFFPFFGLNNNHVQLLGVDTASVVFGLPCFPLFPELPLCLSYLSPGFSVDLCLFHLYARGMEAMCRNYLRRLMML